MYSLSRIFFLFVLVVSLCCNKITKDTTTTTTEQNVTLLGTWETISFSGTSTTKEKVGGVVFQSHMKGSTIDADFKLTFKDSSFVTKGSYTLEISCSNNGDKIPKQEKKFIDI